MDRIFNSFTNIVSYFLFNAYATVSVPVIPIEAPTYKIDQINVASVKVIPNYIPFAKEANCII